jgi:hypothetical protein
MAMGGSIIVRNLPKAHTVQYGTFPKTEISVQSLPTSCKSSILCFLFHNILLLGELFGVWCLQTGPDCLVGLGSICSDGFLRVLVPKTKMVRYL